MSIKDVIERKLGRAEIAFRYLTLALVALMAVLLGFLQQLGPLGITLLCCLIVLCLVFMAVTTANIDRDVDQLHKL